MSKFTIVVEADEEGRFSEEDCRELARFMSQAWALGHACDEQRVRLEMLAVVLREAVAKTDK